MHPLRSFLFAVSLPLLVSIASAAAPLNVILVTADDLGLQVGAYGDRLAATPHLDAFAARGVMFRDAWVVQSSCSPSRSALLTGLWPHQNGQVGLVNGGFSMKPGMVTLPARLKAAGFATGIIGKLHVDPPKAFPFDRAHSGQGVSRHVPNVAQWAGEFFAANRAKPFFLMVNFFDPHRPFVPELAGHPRKKFTAAEVAGSTLFNLMAKPDAAEVAAYYQCVARFDDGLGLLLAAVDRAGLASRTVIMVMSDNGPPFPGAKSTCYEPGLRTPLVVAWPGVAPRVVATPVSLIDIAPTVLDAAGLPPVASLAGKSLRRYFSDNDTAAPADETLIFAEFTSHTRENFFPMRTVKDGRHQLIRNLGSLRSIDGAGGTSSEPTAQTINPDLRDDAPWRQPPYEELFDLVGDPSGRKNVVADPAHAAALRRLRTELIAWQERTADSLRDAFPAPATGKKGAK